MSFSPIKSSTTYLAENLEDEAPGLSGKQKLHRAKVDFIEKLKSFLRQEKGEQIIGQLSMCVLQNPMSSQELEKVDSAHQYEVALNFDIDLIKMIHFDQFLADNFIRCFFRYYPKMSEYVKDIFREGYREQSLIRIKETS